MLLHLLKKIAERSLTVLSSDSVCVFGSDDIIINLFLFNMKTNDSCFNPVHIKSNRIYPNYQQQPQIWGGGFTLWDAVGCLHAAVAPTTWSDILIASLMMTNQRLINRRPPIFQMRHQGSCRAAAVFFLRPVGGFKKVLENLYVFMTFYV